MKLSHSFQLAIAVCLFLTLSMGTWALSSPPGSSPDDDYHLGSIYCGTFAPEELCGKPDSSQNFPGGVVDSSVCFAFQPGTNALCTETKLAGAGIQTNRINQEAHQYPGGFYDFFSLFASKSVIETILLIRFTNSLIFSVLVMIILYSIRFRNKETISAIIISLVPLAFFIVPSTNPSSWAFIGGLTFPFFLTLFIKEGFKIYHLFLTGFSLALCLIARSDGAIPIIIGCILVFGNILVKLQNWRRVSLRSYLAILVPGILSFFHLTYFTMFIKPLSINTVKNDFNLELFFQNLYNSPKLILGVFGSWGLGWLDTPMPIYVSVVLLSLALFNIYFCSLDGQRKFYVGTCVIILLLYPSFTLTTWGTFVGQYFQPRYLLPGVAALTYAILFSLDSNKDPKIIHKLYRYNLTTLILSYSICLYINILRYSVGLGPSQSKLINNGDYWSFPNVNPWVCFLSGTFSMMLALFFANKLIKQDARAIRGAVDAKKGKKSFSE